MHKELSNFAAHLRERISVGGRFNDFETLALELFRLQFACNSAYQSICAARMLGPNIVRHWALIPAAPTSAFKELELSCIPSAERQTVFHSSGTTEQKPSRHFHHAESLAVYETSLWSGFTRHFDSTGQWLFLTPPATAAPHSSLIHMFETVRRKMDLTAEVFAGSINAEGSWTLDFQAIVQSLQSAVNAARPITLLGTAFSFVHLLDHLAETNRRFQLPAGSRVMETGGYKNRSRTMPKAELHQLITARLGVPSARIICEYGMSELSSQAYAMPSKSEIQPSAPSLPPFHFPPWARGTVISPETGREVAEGQPGTIRVFDLANVYSVAAIQTEDLGIRRGNGFELVGRAERAEPRGCSLMTIPA